MAGSLPCMNHPERPAVLTGTFLSNGQTVTVCDSCLVDFAAFMVESLTGFPMAELFDAYNNAEAAGGGEGDETTGDTATPDEGEQAATGDDDSTPTSDDGETTDAPADTDSESTTPQDSSATVTD